MVCNRREEKMMKINHKNSDHLQTLASDQRTDISLRLIEYRIFIIKQELQT